MDLKDAKNIETLFNTKSKFDQKNITNKGTKKVPENILDNIENGVTLENLDDLIKKGFPIFRYETQITLHGYCTELLTERVGMYKNLCLNKNKSIGIRYNAIDIEKKERIGSILCRFGFHTETNSLGTVISKIKVVEKNNVLETINDYKEIENRINKKGLFYGKTNIFTCELFGRFYVVLDITFLAIYEKKIWFFMEAMTNKTKEQIEIEVNGQIEAEQKREIEREIEWQKRKIERENKEKKEIEIFSKKLESDYKQVMFKNITKGSEFIEIDTDYDNNVMPKKWLKLAAYCKPVSKHGKGTKYYHEHRQNTLYWVKK